MSPDDAPDELLEHYRILSEMTSDYAFKFRIDPDGTPVLEWISDNFVRDFGFSPQGPTDVFERVHPDDRHHVAEALEDLYSGQPVEGEVRILPATGGDLWVQYHVKPMWDEEQCRVVGTYGALKDIHERKVAEELWRQAELRFRAQYQASPIPTYTWQRVGDDFVLIDYNRAGEEITKGAVTRLLGKSAQEVFKDDPDIIENLERAFATGETIRRDRRYRMRSTGEEKHLFVSVSRVPPNLVMVHTVDVTFWRKAEADREELRAKLEAAPGGEA